MMNKNIIMDNRGAVDEAALSTQLVHNVQEIR